MNAASKVEKGLRVLHAGRDLAAGILPGRQSLLQGLWQAGELVAVRLNRRGCHASAKPCQQQGQTIEDGELSGEALGSGNCFLNARNGGQRSIRFTRHGGGAMIV